MWVWMGRRTNLRWEQEVEEVLEVVEVLDVEEEQEGVKILLCAEV